MKKFILATAVVAATFAPQAFAQSKNFEGFSLGATANFNNAKTEVPGASYSDTSTTLGLKAAYGWNLGNNFILGAGLSYDTGNIKAGTNAAGTVSVVAKGLTVLSVEPGIKASNDVLIYGKLGYATVRGEASGAVSTSDTYNGNSFGLGARFMVAKGMSVDVEAQQLTFTAQNSAILGGDVKPSASVFAVGFNYHF